MPFNSLGQVERVTDPDNVTTLYVYRGDGSLDYRVLNAKDPSGVTVPVVNLDGEDRSRRYRTEYLSFSANSPSIGVVRTTTEVLGVVGSGGWLTSSITERTFDGLKQWDTVLATLGDSATSVTHRTEVDFPAAGERRLRKYSPDGSYAQTKYLRGRLTEERRFAANGIAIDGLNYEYDAHGRVWYTTDLRQTVTTYTYTGGDLVEIITVSAPSLAPQVTTFQYKNTLALEKQILPGSESIADRTVFTDYFPGGLVQRRYGRGIVPTEYEYDGQGRLELLRTWSSFVGPGNASGVRETKWVYDNAGLLWKKHYPSATGTPDLANSLQYTYTLGGRLKLRRSLRNVDTTYKYDFELGGSATKVGDLVEISYSDGTPTVSLSSYDRRGRLLELSKEGMTTALEYNNPGEWVSESHAGGIHSGRKVTRRFDPKLRPDELEVFAGSASLQRTRYAYDDASRLRTVVDLTGGAEVGYGWFANYSRVNTTQFRSGIGLDAIIRLTTTRLYDGFSRLQSVGSLGTGPGVGAMLMNYAYHFNDRNLREKATLGDGSFWTFDYDSLDQLKLAKRKWSDTTPVAGQQLEYDYDKVGNRTAVRSGGDNAGAGLVPSTFANADTRNQYTTRTVPNRVDVFGSANAAASVSVTPTGQASATALRKGAYFVASPVVSQGVQIGLTINATMAGQTPESQNRSVWSPPATEAYPTPDADGNSLGDSRWTYTWDAENRLTSVESNASAVIAGAPWQRVGYRYDALGRLLERKEYSGSAAAQVLAKTTIYMYGGDKNLCTWESLGTEPMKLKATQVWGLSEMGGGIEGLLLYKSEAHGSHACVYDGAGNLTALVSVNGGVVRAQYEYDAFGNILREGGFGGVEAENPWRFSTKRMDPVTGLVHYEYRTYNPNLGRWLSRDPLEEAGGVNLYGFVGNSPPNRVDPDGRDDLSLLGQNAPVALTAIVGCGKVDRVWPPPDAFIVAAEMVYLQSPISGIVGIAQDTSLALDPEEASIERIGAGLRAGGGAVLAVLGGGRACKALRTESGVARISARSVRAADEARYARHIDELARAELDPILKGVIDRSVGIPRLVDDAISARNSMSDLLKATARRRDSIPPTVSAGYDPTSGRVSAAATLEGRLKNPIDEKCSEYFVARELGQTPLLGDPQRVYPILPLRFVPTIRPSKGIQINVCPGCQADWPRSAFAPDVRFAPLP